MPTLTKSLFMNGEQCTKLLWHAHRKLLPEITLSDKHKFAQGREFEKYAKRLFPRGIDLTELKNDQNIKETARLTKEKKTIFEAGFTHQDLFMKADILEYDNGWNLYEMKASTEVKPQHISDLAFQKFVCEKNGITINKCFVLVLNKEFVKNGEISPNDLVLRENVTEKVNDVKNVEEHAREYVAVLKETSVPDVPIGKHCNKPYKCPLKEVCWAYLPEYNVMQLTNWRQYWSFFEEGILDIKDIPAGIRLVDKDEVIHKAVIENKVIISMKHVKHFMKILHFPLYHFDFETFDTAVPLFDKSRPYQKIPFQYSVHVQHEDGVEHFSFLAEGSGDPRPALLQALKEHIDTTGNIIVFNKAFEKMVLTQLAADFPEHKKWLTDALGRVVDLADVFKNYYYYNPQQHGQYSIKKVLPALTGKSYKDLEINNGGDASMLYFYSHIKHELSGKEEIRKNLLQYCGLDTEGMVLIVKELKNICSVKKHKISK